MNASRTIRSATPEDIPLVLAFIRELAEYERLAHEVGATEEDLDRWLFGPDAVAEVIIAEDNARPVGFALFFRSFSTFLSRPGIWLEDLFVRPEHRGSGHGRALLAELARLAATRGYGRLEWAVLNWNEPAIGFYRALGAISMDDWTTFRLSGAGLDRLAQSSPEPR